MKSDFKAAIVLGLLTLLGVLARPANATPPAGYTIVWDDEFSSTTNTLYTGTPDSNETTGSPPDPAFWTYDTGAGGWNNEELETYDTSNATIVTDSNAPNGTALQVQASESGGDYYSSRIKTQASTTIGTQPQYGYFESVIEAPVGSGLWPAWYMIGEDESQVDWPVSGEMDLFTWERYDVTNGDAYTNLWTGTVDNYVGVNVGNTSITTGAYETFGLLWTPTGFTNYYNNTQVGTTNNYGDPFAQPFYFLYSLAVGGLNAGSVGSTAFPQNLKIGYLRVYQATGSVQTASNASDDTPPVSSGGSAAVTSGTYEVQPEDLMVYGSGIIANSTVAGWGVYNPGGIQYSTLAFSTSGVTPSNDYTIALGNDYCIQAGGWEKGAYLESWPCNGSSLQSWNVVASTSPYYQIKPASSNSLCMYDEGGQLELETCDTSSSDEMYFYGVPPIPPINVAATSGSSPIVISWSASPEATSYNVYRGTVSGGESGTALASGVTSTAYSDSSVSAGVTYYYTLEAVDSNGTSGASSEVNGSLTPAPPTLSVTGYGGSSAILTWTASPGAVVYRVYRSTTSYGETTPSYAGGLTTTSFTDTAVVSGDTYYYEVKAVNTDGASAYSNQVYDSLVAPVAPSSLTATAGNNQVTLNWTASPNATVYRVYRSTTSYGETHPSLAGGLTTTSYVDTNAVNGTTYYYEATAVNSTGPSGYSNQTSATPP